MARMLNPDDVAPKYRGPAMLAKLPHRHLFTVPDEKGEWFDALQSLFAAPIGGVILLLGRRGTGKTQLAVECAKRLIQQTVNRDGEAMMPAYYTSAASLFCLLRAGNDESHPSEATTMRKVTSVPLLIIDEIQERKNSEWEDRTLVNIVDARYGAMLTTILVGNITIENAEVSLGASIVDRAVECGAVLDCQWESFRG